MQIVAVNKRTGTEYVKVEQARAGLLRVYTPKSNSLALPENIELLEKICKYGHVMTERNTYITPKTGKKDCRKCRTERHRNHRPPLYMIPDDVKELAHQMYMWDQVQIMVKAGYVTVHAVGEPSWNNWEYIELTDEGKKILRRD